MSEDLQTEINRVRWHCRRGMLELDLVLARFVDAHFARLPSTEKQHFHALLALQDNDLWALVTGKTADGDPARQAVVDRLRASWGDAGVRK